MGADGYLYANVWYKNVVLRIDIESGLVVDKYNLTSLVRAE
jgi:glutamine cyclotransferase